MIKLEELFEQLVKQTEITSTTGLGKIGDFSDEVLLQTQVNGVDYYLVRSEPRPGQHVRLSPRELAVAKLIAQGLPNKRISSVLQISHWTVSTYLRRIFAKLGVTSRAAMVAQLMEENILEGVVWKKFPDRELE